jgi:hypothetical protein
VEIILHEQATGEGIQKTLAYDTPMSKEELEKWRDEFWGKLNYEFSYTNMLLHNFHKHFSVYILETRTTGSR